MDKTRLGVTGANGFIGSHFLEKLKANRQYEIVVFKGDLLNKKDIGLYFKFNRDINQLVHFAGTFFGNFETLLNVNVVATHNLLKQAIKYKIKKIIYTSTGAVYGESPIKGSVETDELKPNTPYGLSKMWAEDCIQYYANNFNLNYIILRFPNVYGPKSSKGVIYNFLKSIKESSKVVIFGNGEQKRNFLFIDDAVEAIERVLRYKGNNEIFNIADKNIYSLRDVVKILKKGGFKFEVEYQSAEETNALQVLSEDITKAKKIINWRPTVSLKEGIESLVDHI